MSGFDGNGQFIISGSGLPVASATTISSTVQNTLNTDLATGLSTCITKDGQTTVTANLPMATFKHTGAGAASASGEYLTWGGNYVEGTFTPTDASGASLSFTSPVGFYRRIGNIVHVWGSLTYPSTADGTNAKIGSLPVAAANLSTHIGGFTGIVQFGGGVGTPGGSAPNWLIVNKNSTTMSLSYAGGLVLTNANLSTYSVDFYATYPA